MNLHIDINITFDHHIYIYPCSKIVKYVCILCWNFTTFINSTMPHQILLQIILCSFPCHCRNPTINPKYLVSVDHLWNISLLHRQIVYVGVNISFYPSFLFYLLITAHSSSTINVSALSILSNDLRELVI